MAGQGEPSAARFLDVLGLGRREDVAEVLAALPPEELIAGLEGRALQVPDVVLDHVIANGPHAAWLVLADEARRFPSPQSTEIKVLIRRLLRLRDPDVDMALFGLDLPLANRTAWTWVRLAVVRDRVGADGRPVVPARLAARIAERQRGMRRPLTTQDRILSEVLVEAADPALADPARAVLGREPEPPKVRPDENSPVDRMLWFSHWNSPGVASAGFALDWDDVLSLAHQDNLLAEGWISGEQAWFPVRSVGLDEAMGREDCPPDILETLAGAYNQRLPPVWRPDLHAVQCFERWNPKYATYEEDVAAEVVRGLRRASLTAREVLEGIKPARMVAGLAEPAPAPAGPAGLDRAVRELVELRDLLAERLRERLGDDADRWIRVVLAVESRLDRPLAALIDEAATAGPPPAEPATRWWPPPERSGPPCAPNVLLSFAPSDVAAHVLRHLPARTRLMAQRRPLFPALIDAALGPEGDEETRAAVAASPWTPESTMRALVEDPETSEKVLWDVFRTRGDATLRRVALRRLLDQGMTSGRLAEGLRDGPVGISALFDGCTDPVLIAGLVGHVPHFRRAGGRADRLRLYARLAELAGPEPVWALEVKLARTLDRMDETVRASMTSGDAAPLLAGAAEPLPEAENAVPETWPEPPPRDPGWTRAELVRDALDGRADRWLLLAAQFRDPGILAANEDLAALIARVVDALP